jgi:nicotinate phosphoribosyltransferase
MTSTALLTDRYELTMLQAALADGTAHRRCIFEVFTRRLPHGRRYGVLAGPGRVLEALADFHFGDDELRWLKDEKVVDDHTLEWLAHYRFSGDMVGYAEGEVFFPLSPVMVVEGTFAEAVILETLVLSILNYDSAVASAASRMTSAAVDRPCLEMGARRAHEDAAVAAARAAVIAGFAGTSNLEAGRRYGIPTSGTAAHAFTLLHDSEAAAFRAQIDALGIGTTLLVDTYDIARGIRTAIDVAGPSLGAIRIDSGDLAVLAKESRELLDSLGATRTRIVLSGDLDEFAIAGLSGAPVDLYGVGTSLVTGSGAPTAGMVYKLVEVDGRPVAKRSEHKATQGGRKTAVRRHRETGTATEEVLVSRGRPELGPHDRLLQVPLMRGGKRVEGDASDLGAARARLAAALHSVPWEGLKLSQGEPALPTVLLEGTT